ncbi:MAG: hydroxyphenylacetyl-CoA thioesterase PaaI [Woeseia sp.]|nr:hydroxyphenylacetyl-CoA thioesterase PaaI [Woeseia sp.]MBT8097477.1 hydroxyphenylacetyl-CoA thioesterase PaaI [Woeseia sp.]NNE60893.1 hydroxyphenylacetyl-CoA thioesterase PaaI [Woeseia sp.]NNL53949.1 hydroxyphenylacetyl-CoA thioesterase PaaI [Woeseia sp.]
MNKKNDAQRARACRDHMYSADLASQSLGIEVTVDEPGRASATMTITESMLNGQRLCHGGFIFALADSAFAFACNGYDDVTVAGGATIDFLRPGRLGDELTATAVERQRGRRNGVYDVAVQNQDGKDVALFRGKSVATGQRMLGNDA